ncbi:hypothetical protein [Hydrogenispora ethanolica]|uniref:hypothetical protein n=1 Tax=Hydrogenispora ethanolica TaxID=1082276 RepID=UPI00104FAEEA|nr:hypothetical protein [Hydrogenispora ethanolica]
MGEIGTHPRQRRVAEKGYESPLQLNRVIAESSHDGLSFLLVANGPDCGAERARFVNHGSLWAAERALSVAQEALFVEKEFFQSLNKLIL